MNPFISLRGRITLIAEALNMVESISNYVKHRTVPVINPRMGYAVFHVPAVSGESLAHGYQTILADKAANSNDSCLPVCRLCHDGIFLKSANVETLAYAFLERYSNLVMKEFGGKEKILQGKASSINALIEEEKRKYGVGSEAALEGFIVRNCVVEDIGGFLYAPKKQKEVSQLKRTSNFSVGYMVPTLEALESALIEPQMHSRYALGTPFAKGSEEKVTGQMLYNIELASAAYTFSFDLDTKYIGKYTYTHGLVGKIVAGLDELNKDCIDERVSLAVDALVDWVSEMRWGAKKTRYLPLVYWESMVAAVSENGVWTVPSPLVAGYMGNVARKLEKNGNVEALVVYVNEDYLESSPETIRKKTEEIIDAMKRTLGEWQRELEAKMPRVAEKIDFDRLASEKIEKLMSARLDELAAGGHLVYANAVKKQYSKALEELEKNSKVTIAHSLEELLSVVKEKQG